MDNNAYISANRALWDEWADINANSDLYQLDRFLAGENKLNPLERGELGDVQGKRLLHLQCHFGMDTLSWAQLGAEVTGVDFSPRAVQLANELSKRTNLPGRFICCNLYDLPHHLDEQFDIVYTSYGVLGWLPDLTAWAKLINRYLKPGGVFYIAEFHPFSYVFDDEDQAGFRVRYDYFTKDVQQFEAVSYSDGTTETHNKVEYEWMHPLSEVLTVLLNEGFQLEFLHEHPFSVYAQFPFLEPHPDGYYYLPASLPRIPLMFSIRMKNPIL
jgi:SAM-dependent methyltransferase